MAQLKLRDYQREAIKFALDKGNVGILADTGLGKTITTLSLLKTLRAMGQGIKVLIVAPRLAVLNVWPDEIDAWPTFDFTYTVLRGYKREQKLQLNVDIYIINPESLAWLVGQTPLPSWDTLVVDESTMFTETNTVKWKALKKLIPKFRNRYILTGTMLGRGLVRVWTQMYILDEGELLGNKITHFRKKYCRQVGKREFNTWVVREDREQELYRLLKTKTISFDKANYLDIPPITYNTVRVTLPPKAREKYQVAWKELVIEYENGIHKRITSLTARRQMCTYITGGAIPFGHASDAYEVVHDEKIQAVKNIVQELNGKPVMVAYRYNIELNRLKKSFPHARVVNGATTDTQMEEIKSDWNSKKIHVLLVQYQALNYAINLQYGGHDLIWFSLTASPLIYGQLNARLHRSGVQEPVRIHHIVARGTLDVDTLRALRLGISSQEEFYKEVVARHSSDDD